MKSIAVFSFFGECATPFLKLGVPIVHIQLSIRSSFIDLMIETINGDHTIRDIKIKVLPDALALLQARILEALRSAGEDLLIVYAHSDHIFQGVHDLILDAGFPYVFAFQKGCGLPWTHHHFVGSARDRLCFDEEAKDEFKRKYLFDCTVMDSNDTHALRDRLDSCTKRTRLRPLSRPSHEKAMNVLFLSYYYTPALSVAIHRIAYWNSKIDQIAKDVYGTSALTVRSQVMTACESHLNDETALVVPDLGERGVYDSDVRILKARLAAARVNWIAVFWMAHVRNWFKEHPDAHFDAVVMTGNPFFFFGLTDFFKKRFGAQVILDFRDPFSNNPRFEYSPAHKALVEELEDEYLDRSDATLTVNDLCRQSLRLRKNHVSELVPNGFDESIVDTIKPLSIPGPKTKIKFIYTGKFYGDRDATPFVSSLNSEKHQLTHIGWQSTTDDHLDEYAAIQRLGIMNYEAVVAYCKSADAGIIFASGDAFEQTTKIFDYIAANIDIIIITDGVTEYGNLHDMTKGLQGIYWVRNTHRAITKFLSDYKPKRRRRIRRKDFSRGNATRKLVNLLVEGPNSQAPMSLRRKLKASIDAKTNGNQSSRKNIVLTNKIHEEKDRRKIPPQGKKARKIKARET